MQVITWSVVITTHNRAQMLKRCIESALQQSVPVEVIVVDDASTDETEEVALSFGARVLYHRNERPVGHARAANIGLNMAAGSWVKPMDDDDYLTADCLSEMGAKLRGCFARGENPVIISGRIIRIDEHGNHRGVLARPMSDVDTYLPSRRLLQCMLRDRAPVGTPLQCAHSREAALAVGGWNESVREGEDIQFWIRLTREGGCFFTSLITGYRTEWSGNSHHSLEIVERYLAHLDLKVKIAEALKIKLRKRIVRRVAIHWVLVAIKHSKFRQAAMIALRA